MVKYKLHAFGMDTVGGFMPQIFNSNRCAWVRCEACGESMDLNSPGSEIRKEGGVEKFYHTPTCPIPDGEVGVGLPMCGSESCM